MSPPQQLINALTPYSTNQTGTVTLYHGDVLDVLSALPEASVHCCITSPPYWGLRDYGEPGQLGLEPLHDCAGWATGAPGDSTANLPLWED